MQTHVDKNHAHQNHSTTVRNDQKQNADPAFQFADKRPEAIQMRELQAMADNYAKKNAVQFVDNRPEAVAQRKLQEMANNSPQALQLKAFQDIANNSPQAKQVAQLQAMADNYSGKVLQKQEIKEEETLIQKKEIDEKEFDTGSTERPHSDNLFQKKENNTGLPDNLKKGMENLSGVSLDDVKVHRNSDKPAQLQAHAYAQGTDIHLGPRQEKYLPHEAWHVVQQKQGRVSPTSRLKGIFMNDSTALEDEADVMGQKTSTFKEEGLRHQELVATSPRQASTEKK